MTPLAWPVRVWIVAEIVFGLAGASAVLIAPAESATNFAWPVNPPVSAAVIGAFYGAVAVMLVPAVFARWWEEVRIVVVSAAVLTSLLLVATVLHWEVFAVGTTPFALWLISYLLPPPTLVALYAWQQRGRPAELVPLARPWSVRNLAAVNGAGHVVVWGVLFVVPSLLASHGPWPMSELVVRVFAGWFVAYGVLLWSIGRRYYWTEGRLATLWLIALPLLLVVQLSRFREQVEWTHGGLVVILADVCLVGACAGWLWSRHHGTARRLAMVAAIGVSVFLIALVAMPLLRPDLDVWARWVGEYARGPFSGLMVGAYLALGVGTLALALALRSVVSGRLGPRVLALASLGAFVAALLPQDYTDGGVRTAVGTVRDLALIPIFVLLITALTLLTRAFFRQVEWRSIALPAAGLVIVALAALGWAIAGPVESRGIAGRVWDGGWTAWLLLTAVHLLRTPASRTAPEATPHLSGPKSQ